MTVRDIYFGLLKTFAVNTHTKKKQIFKTLSLELVIVTVQDHSVPPRILSVYRIIRPYPGLKMFACFGLKAKHKRLSPSQSEVELCAPLNGSPRTPCRRSPTPRGTPIPKRASFRRKKNKRPSEAENHIECKYPHGEKLAVSGLAMLVVC